MSHPGSCSARGRGAGLPGSARRRGRRFPAACIPDPRARRPGVKAAQNPWVPSSQGVSLCHHPGRAALPPPPPPPRAEQRLSHRGRIARTGQPWGAGGWGTRGDSPAGWGGAGLTRVRTRPAPCLRVSAGGGPDRNRKWTRAGRRKPRRPVSSRRSRGAAAALLAARRSGGRAAGARRRHEAVQPERPVQRRPQGRAAQRRLRRVVLQLLPEDQVGGPAAGAGWGAGVRARRAWLLPAPQTVPSP